MSMTVKFTQVHLFFTLFFIQKLPHYRQSNALANANSWGQYAGPGGEFRLLFSYSCSFFFGLRKEL